MKRIVCAVLVSLALSCSGDDDPEPRGDGSGPANPDVGGDGDGSGADGGDDSGDGDGNGNGGGDGGGSDSDTEAPSIAVDFPALRSITDATTIRVIGRASDAGEVSRVTVNGVEASSVNGFESWEAEVQLERGDNELRVSAVDADGNEDDSQAVVVTRTLARNERPALTSRMELTLDSDNRRLYLSGRTEINDGVYALDLGSGASELLSGRDPAGNQVGTGLDIRVIRDPVLDAANGRLIAADRGNEVVFAVDLETGNRTVLVDAGEDDPGTQLNGVGGVALDPLGQRVFVTNSLSVSGQNGRRIGIIEVDLQTDDRRFFLGGTNIPQHIAWSASREVVYYLDSSNGNFLELDPSEPDVPARRIFFRLDFDEFVWDDDDNRLLFVNENLDIVEVDPDDGGNRPVLVSGDAGSGPQLASVSDLELADDNTLYVSDRFLDAVLSVDLDTGARNLIVGTYQGTGPWAGSFWSPTVVDGSLYSVDPRQDRAFRVDLETGDREELFTVADFEGAVESLFGICVGETEGSFIVADNARAEILSVQLTDDTPTTAVLSGGDNGPALEVPIGIVCSADLTTAWVLDRQADGLFAVDLTSGDRELIATIADPATFSVDASESQAFVTSDTTNTVVSVDLETGETAVVAERNADVENDLLRPSAVLYEPTLDSFLVWDDRNSELLRIDGSGSRTRLLGEGQGAGPLLLGVDAILPTAHPRLVWVASRFPSSVQLVDLQTGDRVIVSGGGLGSDPRFWRDRE